MSEKKTPSSNTGKPGTFKKGPDSRRHMNGQISKKQLDFNRTFRELIIAEGGKSQTDGTGAITKTKQEWLVYILFQSAIKGEAWAVNIILDRTEGKVPLNVGMEHSGEVTVNVRREIVKSSK